MCMMANSYVYRTVLYSVPHGLSLQNHRDESFCHHRESRLPRQASQYCITAPLVEQEVHASGRHHAPERPEAGCQDHQSPGDMPGQMQPVLGGLLCSRQEPGSRNCYGGLIGLPLMASAQY